MKLISKTKSGKRGESLEGSFDDFAKSKFSADHFYAVLLFCNQNKLKVAFDKDRNLVLRRKGDSTH